MSRIIGRSKIKVFSYLYIPASIIPHEIILFTVLTDTPNLAARDFIPVTRCISFAVVLFSVVIFSVFDCFSECKLKQKKDRHYECKNLSSNGLGQYFDILILNYFNPNSKLNHTLRLAIFLRW